MIREIGDKQIKSYKRIASKKERKYEVSINSSGDVVLSLILYLPR